MTTYSHIVATFNPVHSPSLMLLAILTRGSIRMIILPRERNSGVFYRV